MPFKIRKVPNKKKCYEVVNDLTGHVHAKCTTKPKAEAQIRIIEESLKKNNKK